MKRFLFYLTLTLTVAYHLVVPYQHLLDRVDVAQKELEQQVYFRGCIDTGMNNKECQERTKRYE